MGSLMQEGVLFTTEEMQSDINIVFFELISAGLWGNGNPEIRIDGTTDWNYIYRLAQEQSVQGIVLQGIETVQGSWLKVHGSPLVPKVLLLQWIGEVQLIEQRNKEMNVFIAELIEKLRKNDIDALLVKGQGVAQCYEKPLWRSCGDVDLFLSDSNYEKAKKFLVLLASEVETEYVGSKHLGMTIDGWVVELHGTLQCNLSRRVKGVIVEIENNIIYGGQVRSWLNNQVQIFLPSAENDAIYIFAHFLNHFYKEGVGLRQICDWCRLLYTYKDSLNYGLLEQRIKRAGLMSEWKAFGALAIEYLGFPKDSMPLLDVRSKKEDVRWRKKADRIMEFILKSGNMGHNRDMSHFSKYPYIIRKCVSMGRRVGDLINHARIFPLDSLRFFPRIMFNGVRSAMRGE